MIKFLIFSKDRASQLDALITSIYKFYDSNQIDISVLYKSTHENYQVAYDSIVSQNGLNFIKENNFREDTLSIINSTNTEYIAISTDDTVLYRKFKLDNVLPIVMNQCDVFSLRYGYNTVIQDFHLKTYQPSLRRPVELLEGKVLLWNWTEYEPLHNYGYPFGLDMHIFKRQQLLSLLESFNWKNTNEMESGLFYLRHKISPLISSFSHSVAVNIPINNMSGVTIAGKYYSYSVEDLNEMFLNGYKIEYNFIEKDIIGCHQEVPVLFKK